MRSRQLDWSLKAVTFFSIYDAYSTFVHEVYMNIVAEWFKTKCLAWQRAMHYKDSRIENNSLREQRLTSNIA